MREVYPLKSTGTEQQFMDDSILYNTEEAAEERTADRLEEELPADGLSGEQPEDWPADPPSASELRKKKKEESREEWRQAFREFPWSVYFGGAATALLALGAFFFVFLSATIADEATGPVTLNAFRKIWQVSRIVADNYAGEYDSRKLTDGIYDGMLAGLEDPYADYYTADEYETIRKSQSGMKEGIGIRITLDDEERLLVESVLVSSPAEEAGAEAGDIILEINGTDTAGMTPSEAASLIQESESKEIRLKVLRDEEEVVLSMEKGEIETTAAAGALIILKKDGDLTENLIEAIENAREAGSEETEITETGAVEDSVRIGYIQIATFNALTAPQFGQAYESLNEMGMEALIIDLRDNLGGLVNSCIDTLSIFMPEGPLVYEKNRTGEEEHRDSPGTDPIRIPLVLLVNGYSASASEIFAGAVQDYGIAAIVGTTTYGKGVEQNSYSLPDGSVVKITTTHYYTPDHRDIDGIGLTPDVEIEYDPEAPADTQLQKAAEILLAEQTDDDN